MDCDETAPCGAKLMPTYRSSAYGVVILGSFTVSLLVAAIYMLVVPSERTGEILWSSVMTCGALGAVTGALLVREIRDLQRSGRLQEEMRILKPSGVREWLERAKNRRL